jgi:hypothetical protein
VHGRLVKRGDGRSIDLSVRPRDRIRRHRNVDEQVGQPGLDTGGKRRKDFDESAAFVKHDCRPMTTGSLYVGDPYRARGGELAWLLHHRPQRLELLTYSARRENSLKALIGSIVRSDNAHIHPPASQQSSSRNNLSIAEIKRAHVW